MTIYVEDNQANIRKNNINVGQILSTTRLEVGIQDKLI